MSRVRVKGFHIFTDRHGKRRCYHRATRVAVDLDANPIGSVGFIAECSRIAALAEAGQDPKPGTLGLLIRRYRAHSAFGDLAPRTRADYQRIFDYLAPIADTPLRRFDPPLVVRIRDKAADAKGRRFGTYTKTVLSLLFAWGVERGFLAANPANKIKAVKKPRDAPEANRPWRDHERDAVLAALPSHMRGQRRKHRVALMVAPRPVRLGRVSRLLHGLDLVRRVCGEKAPLDTPGEQQR